MTAASVGHPKRQTVVADLRHQVMPGVPGTARAPADTRSSRLKQARPDILFSDADAVLSDTVLPDTIPSDPTLRLRVP